MNPSRNPATLALLDAAAHYRDALVAFLQALVQTPSVNGRHGERAVAERIAQEAGKLGIPAQLIAANEQRPNVLVSWGSGELGFDLIPGDHPIIPVMLGDAKLAGEMADRLLAEGVYVVGFSYPVVPEGKARIRTQMSAGLEQTHIDRAIAAFEKVGRELGVIDQRVI